MIKIDKNLPKRYFLRSYKELLVIAFVLFIDLLSKFLVDKYMDLYQRKVVISKFFNIYYTKNPAAAFSFDFFGLADKLGENGMRIFFIVFVSVVTLIFIAFLVTGYKNRFLYRLPLALIVSGALGNLYDRIFHQSVRDFLQIEYFGGTLFGEHYFPTFNLADSALVIGGILFLIYFIFFFSKDEKKKAEEKKRKKAAEADQNNIEEDSGIAKANQIDLIDNTKCENIEQKDDFKTKTTKRAKKEKVEDSTKKEDVK